MTVPIAAPTGVVPAAAEGPAGDPGPTMTAPADLMARVDAHLAKHEAHWWDLALAVHARPELGLAEFHAAALLTAALAEQGFAVTRGLAGMPTAFRAEFGDGPLTVALTAEYDALPGLGHACGHNLIGTMALAAASALRPVADAAGIRVVVLGCPAEENAGGKIYLAEAGVFDDIHLAAQIHPANRDELCPATLANDTLTVRYRGRSAHASSFPERGRNAYDAITVASVALGLLRQQLPSSVRVHTLVTETGAAVNIIHERTAMTVKIRAADVATLEDVTARVGDCLRAGGLATGCETTVERVLPRFAEIRYDRLLAELFARASPRFADADLAYLGGSGETYTPPSGRAASTDVGNLSWLVPTIQPMLRLDTGGSGNHEPAFTAAAASPSARVLLADGAHALAGALLAAGTRHAGHYLAAGTPARRAARLAEARAAEVVDLGVPMITPPVSPSAVPDPQDAP
ncbi:M20 family metallopeptidase [Frankia sp. AgKG'84/4]|uniref:M20 family metallopeptidase n=1 Tax=Frankia sp. AgKG'84/4 TaxID=573490 RepID=UPI00200D8535|nr:M20 family metallopeptidase [Frankia sp. AgKG'84/4]MCL9796604.1 M20 family metallopeptidase [Frankia sp. AgKG'84/4]